VVTRLLKLAVIYLIIGLTLGVFMGNTHQFQLRPVHVHVNLLGWVTLALTALVYQLYPRMIASRLAGWHFWLHSVGLPIGMAGLTVLVLGNPDVGGPIAGIGSIAAALGLALFAVNLWRNGKI